MCSSTRISSFDELVANTKKFFVAIPTNGNRIETIAGNDLEKQDTIVQQANGTRIIVRENVISLIEDFLNVKREYGSRVEKNLYKNMNRREFIQRLLLKRPLMFVGPFDRSLMRDKTVIADGDDWLKVGTDEEANIRLQEYLSYDEMQISALIGVSTPTYFINDGNRRNAALIDDNKNFEETGIIVGLVGSRFARASKMENQHMIITSEQSTTELGYGKAALDYLKKESRLFSRFSKKDPKRIHNTHLLRIWAKFYGLGDENEFYFPSYKEAVALEKNDDERFVRVVTTKKNGTTNSESFFNVDVYKKRMSITAETLLLEANNRGEIAKKRVYVHIVGFGLGVWQILPRQGEWFVSCFDDAIKRLKLPWISTMNFAWFPRNIEYCGKTKNGDEFVGENGNKIRIEFSKRNTADKLTSDELLVTSFAWDSNSFPGNEYWFGSLMTSSDPSAACCSTIPQLQNPYINPFYENIKTF